MDLDPLHLRRDVVDKELTVGVGSEQGMNSLGEGGSKITSWRLKVGTHTHTHRYTQIHTHTYTHTHTHTHTPLEDEPGHAAVCCLQPLRCALQERRGCHIWLQERKDARGLGGRCQDFRSMGCQVLNIDPLDECTYLAKGGGIG